MSALTEKLDALGDGSESIYIETFAAMVNAASGQISVMVLQKGQKLAEYRNPRLEVTVHSTNVKSVSIEAEDPDGKVIFISQSYVLVVLLHQQDGGFAVIRETGTDIIRPTLNELDTAYRFVLSA